MCDPVTLIATAAVAKGAGSIMSGNAANDAAQAQADQVTLQARQRARSIRYMAKQTLGAARADYAASGVDVNSGSPLVASDTINFNSEVDALNAIASGEATARSIRRSGKAQQSAGYLDAAGSLLGAFASASDYGGVTAGGGGKVVAGVGGDLGKGIGKPFGG
jgi:hypothetical protein